MAISNRSLQSQGVQVNGYETGRPVVHGTQGLVSAGHYLTAMSAMKMLVSGGNAFDAAVATAVPGAATVAELEDNVRMMQVQIPADLWAELKSENLLPAAAPTP